MRSFCSVSSLDRPASSVARTLYQPSVTSTCFCSVQSCLPSSPARTNCRQGSLTDSHYSCCGCCMHATELSIDRTPAQCTDHDQRAGVGSPGRRCRMAARHSTMGRCGASSCSRTFFRTERWPCPNSSSYLRGSSIASVWDERISYSDAFEYHSTGL